ncbi:MAG: YbhB/YbcL family Raf kinase inhibitor-like protein [Terracidiphilus sp.]
MGTKTSQNRKSIGSESRQMAWGVLAVLLFAAVALTGCRGSLARGQTMNLTSTSFSEGSWIPAKFTCNGAGVSPQLAWSAPPAGTVSFALIVTDPDAPGRTFVHWVLYGLPATTQALPEGVPAQGQLADGSCQGRNDFGDLGYGGSCPPRGAPHHYVFTLYALDAKLNLPVGATRAQVEAAMHGHILARGQLIGLFQR